jgi:hypothetical protein
VGPRFSVTAGRGAHDTNAADYTAAFADPEARSAPPSASSPSCWRDRQKEKRGFLCARFHAERPQDIAGERPETAGNAAVGAPSRQRRSGRRGSNGPVPNEAGPPPPGFAEAVDGRSRGAMVGIYEAPTPDDLAGSDPRRTTAALTLEHSAASSDALGVEPRRCQLTTCWPTRTRPRRVTQSFSPDQLTAARPHATSSVP